MNLLTLLALVLPALSYASLIYIPHDLDTRTARMVVALHGCLQSSESMTLGSGWNQMADKHNLVVLYPQVNPGSHPQDCWRYWDKANLRKGQGDLLAIHQEIERWKHQLHLSDRPVFLTGMSSGAALGASLLACYPEDFAAAALHSGLSYALAASQSQALQVQRWGPEFSAFVQKPCDPRRFEGPVMVLHGNRDAIVHPAHAQRILDDFVGHAKLTRTCEIENGRSFEITDLHVDGVLRGRKVIVNRLAHAWSGCALDLRRPDSQRPGSVAALPIRFRNWGEAATQTVPFFSNKGPSATQMSYRFFDETSNRSR